MGAITLSCTVSSVPRGVATAVEREKQIEHTMNSVSRPQLPYTINLVNHNIESYYFYKFLIIAFPESSYNIEGIEKKSEWKKKKKEP